MLRLTGHEVVTLALGCGGFCVVIFGVMLTVLAVGLAGLGLRRRGSPAARVQALEALGYRRINERSWSMPLRDTELKFDQFGRGWQWTVRLPGDDNTLTLQVEERASGVVPEGPELHTGHPDLDTRFAMGAESPAQTLELVTHRAVRRAMLAMPFLSLHLQGDELVIHDPQLRGLVRLTDGSVTPGSHETVGAECDIHEAVVALVTAFIDLSAHRTADG